MKVKIEGIFCKEKMARIGTGYTLRRTLQKTYWYIENEGNVFSCWPISATGDKIGTAENMDKALFAKSFIPEFSYPQEREITEEDIKVFLQLFQWQIEYKEEESAKKLLRSIYELQSRFPADLSLFLLEIGSVLRKGGLCSAALLSYTYVQESGIDSVALYFNKARVYFDMKDYTACIENLKEAHKRSDGANPSIKKLVSYMQQNALVPRELRAEVNQMMA